MTAITQVIRMIFNAGLRSIMRANFQIAIRSIADPCNWFLLKPLPPDWKRWNPNGKSKAGVAKRKKPSFAGIGTKYLAWLNHQVIKTKPPAQRERELEKKIVRSS